MITPLLYYTCVCDCSAEVDTILFDSDQSCLPLKLMFLHAHVSFISLALFLVFSA